MSDQIRLVGIERALVKEKLLTELDVLAYSKAAKDAGLDIISYIQAKSLVSETDLAHLISKQLGFGYINLEQDFDVHEMPKNLVDEAIVTQYQILPLFAKENKIVVAIGNPASVKGVDKLGFSTGSKIEVRIAEPTKIFEILEANYEQLGSDKAVSTEDLVRSILTDGSILEDEQQEDQSNLPDLDSNAPAVQFINKLLRDAIRQKASDLHFEPFEKYYRIRFRIDGVLRFVEQLPTVVATRLSSRLKVMAGMDISEKRNPQDGRIRLKISEKKAIDFRVNSLPTVYGEKIVLRILDPSSAKLGIDSLGYEPEQKERFMHALHQPQGMILITGPTGSGKTVSLYTGLNILNTMDTNISTAEDPVEINLDGINQVSVNPKTGLTFANALRAFLRQDPDVIMVGEIRDLETAEIAIKAAQTGHMVMSTLHTNSAPETLTRLRNMGVPAFNIATSVNLVIAQRLARRLCSECKKPADIPKETLLEIGFTEEDINDENFVIYESAGCRSCSEGYKGRVGVYEVMPITPEISKLIMLDGNAIQIAEASEKAGFHSLRKSGLRKVKSGMTTIQEIMRITSA